MTNSESASAPAAHDAPLGHAIVPTGGPTLTDKIVGLKEEIQGTITHNPELVQHGKDLLSGATHVPIPEQTPEEKEAEAARLGPVDTLVGIQNSANLK